MTNFFAEQLPESVIKQLSLKVKAIGGVNLGQGIPSFPTAPHILRAAKSALQEKNIGVYPNFLGTLELREAIVQKLNHQYQLNLSNQEILITVGAMEATATTILSLIQNDDRVGVITPDYCNHYPQIALARGRLVEISLDEKDSWQLNLKKVEVEAKIGLKLLILTNPNNPTGAVFTKEELKQLITLAQKYGFWILADETYNFLTYETASTSLLEFYAIANRLLIVRSFSKEYAMTGWRVGYLIAAKEFITLAARTHDALVGCVPKISQSAALAAISGSQAIVTRYQKILSQRRSNACVYLDGLNEFLTYVKPQGAYYIFPRFKNRDAFTLCDEMLNRAGVAVVPGDVFGKAGAKHFRLSFAVEETTLNEGFKRLKKFFKNSVRA